MARKDFLIGGFALAALFVFAGCSKDPVKLGLSLVLTGINSEIGVTGRNGAELALARINAAGGVKGRQLVFVIRDDKNDPDEAVKADEELLSAGVVAIIGHMSSRSGLKAIPYMNDRSKLLISPTISSAAYNAKDDWFFRMIAPNDRQGRNLAEYAYRDLGLRRISSAYEYSNRAYTENVYRSFKTAFEALGGKVDEAVVLESTKDFDFRGFAARLAASKPDGILSVASPYENGNLCQQLALLGSDLPVFAGMWAMTEDLLRYGGKTADRMRIAGAMDPTSKKQRFLEFGEEYKKRYGENPTFASVYSFEAVEVLASAMRRASSFEPADLKKALLSLGEIDGLQDRFSFDGFGDTDRGYLVFSVRDGAFHRVR